MGARYLLVDGHSVIHSWDDLRVLHRTRPTQARHALIAQLRELHDAGPWAVTLVFDGRQGTAEPREPNDLVVHYSEAGETADSVIERLIGQKKNLAPDILVITADEAERRTVEALGAFTASPEWLREELRARKLDVAQALNLLHRKNRW
jgi:predicted RNA-binding protein with PIN domain